MFSNKLKEIRTQKNITQEELGKQFNVSKSAVSNWESGNRFPDEPVLIQIADYFDVSLDELLDRKNSYIEGECLSFFREFKEDSISVEEIKQAVKLIRYIKNS